MMQRLILIVLTWLYAIGQTPGLSSADRPLAEFVISQESVVSWQHRFNFQ